VPVGVAPGQCTIHVTLEFVVQKHRTSETTTYQAPHKHGQVSVVNQLNEGTIATGHPSVLLWDPFLYTRIRWVVGQGSVQTQNSEVSAPPFHVIPACKAVLKCGPNPSMSQTCAGVFTKVATQASSQGHLVNFIAAFGVCTGRRVRLGFARFSRICQPHSIR
jgi:hypothetical protein